MTNVHCLQNCQHLQNCQQSRNLQNGQHLHHFQNHLQHFQNLHNWQKCKNLHQLQYVQNIQHFRIFINLSWPIMLVLSWIIMSWPITFRWPTITIIIWPWFSICFIFSCHLFFNNRFSWCSSFILPGPLEKGNVKITSIMITKSNEKKTPFRSWWSEGAEN